MRLLVEILPVLAQEPRFALKGGTAINLFEHDLPRLSVDIDLAWLPVHDYAEDAKLITEALARLADALRARPLQLQVQTSAGECAGTVTRLVASRGRARVQIETTPVMRGTVHPVRSMVVRPRVVEAFGFAEVQVLDFADLYAGKLAAALSRQHPRDLRRAAPSRRPLSRPGARSGAIGPALGFSVVAEGVETQAQRLALHDMGCEYYQGYLCAPALPAAEFRAQTAGPAADSKRVLHRASCLLPAAVR